MENKKDNGYFITNKKFTKASVLTINKKADTNLINKNDASVDSIDDKVFFYQVDKKFQLNYTKPIKPKNGDNNYIINSKINDIYNENYLFGLFNESISENKNLIISKLDIELVTPQSTYVNTESKNDNYNINKDYKKEFERNIKHFLQKNKEVKKNIRLQKGNSNKIEKNINQRTLTDLISYGPKNICFKTNSNKVKILNKKTSKISLNKKTKNKDEKEIQSNQSNRYLLKNRLNLNNVATKILTAIPKINKPNSRVNYNKKLASKQLLNTGIVNKKILLLE